MTQVFLQPASNREARGHFRDTVETPVLADLILEHLRSPDPALAAVLERDGAVATWGMTPGPRKVRLWASMREGDLVLFYGTGGFYAAGTVVATERNEDLAGELWGVDQTNGTSSTWEHVYFLRDARPIELGMGEFQALTGYSRNWVQGPERLADGAAAKVLAALDASAGSAAGGQSGLGPAPTFGDLDRRAAALQRAEQGYLRRRLFGRSPGGRCTLCGRTLPVGLLVAAHLKRRADCTDAERRDFANVVAPMCRLGCDELYERGFVYVDPGGGKVRVRPSARAWPDLEAPLGAIVGRVCAAWEAPGSRPYLVWHAAHGSRAS